MIPTTQGLSLQLLLHPTFNFNVQCPRSGSVISDTNFGSFLLTFLIAQNRSNGIMGFTGYLSQKKRPEDHLRQAYFDWRDAHADVGFFESYFVQCVGDDAHVVEVVDRSVQSPAHVVDEAERVHHQVAVLGVAVTRVAQPPSLRLRTKRLFQLICIHQSIKKNYNGLGGNRHCKDH